MTYDLYVFDISYFSGKMEAYLNYKGLPVQRHEPTWGQIRKQIYPNTGWMKLPVVRTEDGIWLQDSTPMIQWFEAKHATPAVIPLDPLQRFFSLLLEDYADEWLWRPALYYRWAFAKDRNLYRERFSKEFLRDFPLPEGLTGHIAVARQWWIYMHGDGVSSETAGHIESVYLRTLDRLQAIFSIRPFLLGERPTVADFGFFASMYRHFSIDPTPSEIMQTRAPAVFDWVRRMKQVTREVGDRPLCVAEGEIPEDWGPLLQDVGSSYLPYLHDNARAWAQGRKRFDFRVDGVTYRDLPAVQYRAWCRETLQAEFRVMPKSSQKTAELILQRHGAWDVLWADGVIPSGYDVKPEAPAERNPVRISKFADLLGYAWGTAWNRATGVEPGAE